MIYLDHNATTIMAPDTVSAMVKWCNQGNPSSSYPSAANCRRMMNAFKKLLGSIAGVNVCCKEARDSASGEPGEPIRGSSEFYKVVFVSGASEANSSIIHAAYARWLAHNSTIPHFIASAIEHKSILLTIDHYVQAGFASVTLVQPNYGGHIAPSDIARAIGADTCLVCVMHANNETGAINDVNHILAICAARGVPFHCDTVQTFGKLPLCAADSMCVSFHKLYGPPGAGAWIFRERLGLGAIICGTQNEGLRGGTENIPGLGASYHALQQTIRDRPRKNAMMMGLKTLFINTCRAHMPVRTYEEYKRVPGKAPLELIIFGASEQYLAGTLLFAIKSAAKICNTTIKNKLQQQGIVVSIGSACNTASAQASHILRALEADEVIRRGTLRMSLGDLNTKKEVLEFARALLTILQS